MRSPAKSWNPRGLSSGWDRDSKAALWAPRAGFAFCKMGMARAPVLGLASQSRDGKGTPSSCFPSSVSSLENPLGWKTRLHWQLF